MRFERVMPSGRTRPVLLECARSAASAHVRGRFVVKAIGLPEVQPFSLAHELLGSRLAIVFGLSAPRAHVVSITDAFLQAARDDFAAAGVRLNSGLAVGTEFVPNLIPFPADADVADAELLDAAAIYLFDLMTQNADRTRTSPNCARVAGQLVPYDFETAFGFRFAVPRVEAWRVGGLPFARRHLFHRALVRADIDWEPVFQQFASVVATDLAEPCSTIPEAWVDIGLGIREHLAAVRDHWSEFRSEVVSSLRS